MDTAILNKLIDDFSHLSVGDKEYAIEVVKKTANRSKARRYF